MSRITKPDMSNVVTYLSLFTIINVLTVPLHELGHAVFYALQGYAVEIHITRVVPLGGTTTLLGESGGLTVNIVLAGACLYFFLKYKYIVFYSFVMANTVFVRLLLYAIRMGRPYADEAAIASILNINPYYIVFIVISIMSLFSITAFIAVLRMKDRRAGFIIGLCTVLSAILGYALMLPMDSAGL